jgi:virulence factor Mce-like protein
MKRVLLSAVLLLAVGAFVVIASGASKQNTAGTYKVELDDAFGLVSGADFKVAGVPAGTIKAIDLDQKTLHAVVTVQVTSTGFGHFHSDATCDSRPESLIGEYFIDCNPGSSGPVLKSGATIPVSHTQSTIPADLVQDVMRLPYRQRLTLIVNELGAAAAARSGDLQSALRRAVPALTQTDNLLNLLGNDSTTIQNLTRDSDTVITALANNSAQVNRFIDEAGHTAADTATQQGNLRTTIARLPGLLGQLRPTLKQLGTTVTTNEPVLRNLNSAAGELDRLFTDLPGFSRSARPAIRTLGTASVTGKAAVIAAKPTISDLNQFAKPTPELAQNLAIVLKDLDDPSRAVEKDPRSPGGNGFTGLQALLGYAFNQALAINTYGPEGHMLAVDAFVSSMCSPYATPASIALDLKQDGASYRNCYSWLGPNQPGVNETDPSDPSAAVPDPGGSPPGQSGPKTAASKLTAAMVQAMSRTGTTSTTSTGTTSTTTPSGTPVAQTGSATTATGTTTTTTTTTTSGATTGTSPTVTAPPIDLGQTLGQLLGGLSRKQKKSSRTSASQPSGTGSSAGSGSSGSSGPAGQAASLLNYLLAP